MLIHPPIVFLGYAAWGVPFALAAAALMSGRLNNAWLQQARPWSLFAWTTLGGGILLGAEWAYEQLGWGGYWAWDPVENGSLMPWLTGTALIHGLMTWRQGALKKTTLFLAIATFGLCNFATFLTRSGIFSSLHAFSQSPIGWMFLFWIAAFVVGGTLLILRRKKQLAAEKPLAALWSREALVLLGILALVLLTTVTLLGTLAGAISGLFSATPIMVGLAFYNNVLIPTGLVLLAVVAAVPLIRWGAGPTPRPSSPAGNCRRHRTSGHACRAGLRRPQSGRPGRRGPGGHAAGLDISGDRRRHLRSMRYRLCDRA